MQRLPLRVLIQDVAFSPNGKVLVTTKFQNVAPMVQAWDIATGKEIATFEAQAPDHFVRLAISPNGALLAGAGGQSRVWDFATGKERWRVFRPAGLGLAFSPNGQMLAIGMVDGTVRLYEATTGRERATIKTDAPCVRAVAFSPCGLMMATGGDEARPWCGT